MGMNKALVAALAGVLGLALGFGTGWLWDTIRGGDEAAPTPSPSVSVTPAS